MTTVQPIRTITTAEAKITTVEVSIRTMTIGQKQMTLSVYKQLYSEPLIDTETTQLRGVPWGKVNYFPGNCTPDHLHIVWQKGAELRRACVYSSPCDLYDNGWAGVRVPPLETISAFANSGVRALATAVAVWARLLLLTEQEERIVPLLRDGAVWDRSTNAPAAYLARQDVWPLSVQDIAVDIRTSQAIRAAFSYLWKNDRSLSEALGVQLLKEVAATIRAAADLKTAETQWGEKVDTQVKQLRRFRDQWRAQYDALDALDHLFIAV